MAANILKPGSSFPTPALVGDLINSYPAANGLPASGPGGTPSFTQVTVDGVLQNPSIAFEMQSTTGGFLPPRMTAAQRLALIPSPAMQVYELDTEAVWWYLNAAWVQVNPSSGGNVDGPNPATVDAIAVYGNTLGTAIVNTLTLLDPATGNMTGVGTIHAADSTAAAPAYSFTGRTGQGMYSVGASTLGFSTNGVVQLEILGAASTVNFLSITGEATSANLAANAPIISSSNSSDAEVDVAILSHGAGSGLALLANDAAGASVLRFWNGANTFWSAIKAGANTSDLTWTLPVTAPTAGQILSSSDTAGTLNWISAGNVSTTVASAVANSVITFNANDSGVIQSTPMLVALTSGNVSNSGTTASILMGPQSSFPAASAPTYSFTHGATTGMYLAAANTVGFAADSSLHFSIGSGVAATNYLHVTGGINGSAPIIQAIAGSDALLDIDLVFKGEAGQAAGISIYDGTATVGGLLKLYNAAATEFIGLQNTAAAATTITYTLPLAPAASGDVMTSTTGGVMSWATPASLLVGNGVQIATGTISAAAFNGAYATPVQLVAAGGANTLLVPVAFGLELVYGTTQFAGGGVVSMQYANTAHAGGTLCTATVAAATFTGATAKTIIGTFAPFLPTALNTALVNTGLYLSNASGAFTTGDSTFNYYVAYMTVTTT